MSVDLSGTTVFVAVAEARSFRGAAERLGVTHSAVSQSIRRLENRLGLALVSRTTRSVGLTEAGERLYEKIAPAVVTIGAAFESTGDLEARPNGLIRLAVSSIAERFVSGPLLATFLDRFPDVVLDVTITDEEFDIVTRGYDAGVRLGEVIEQDMVAIPVSGGQRQLVVASPAYLARFGHPKHPRELAQHSCIGWRPSPEVVPYRWESEENGREFTVAVNPRLSTNDMGLMIRTALAGGGLTFGLEETFRPYMERGELMPLLEEYGPPFAGFYLYLPSRQNLAPKIRALIDHVRQNPT